jgi:hypothetical protein
MTQGAGNGSNGHRGGPSHQLTRAGLTRFGLLMRTGWSSTSQLHRGKRCATVFRAGHYLSRSTGKLTRLVS